MRTNSVREVKRVQQMAAPKGFGKKDTLALMRTVRARVNTQDIAIVTLLLHTGLRVAELCTLQTEDLKLGERRGEVRVQYGRGMKVRVVPSTLQSDEPWKTGWRSGGTQSPQDRHHTPA